MWTSILAQSVKELCLSCLGECFVWPSLQFIGLYSVLFFPFFLFLKLKKKKFHKLILVSNFLNCQVMLWLAFPPQ